jgi:hypothetical protein
MSDLATHRKLVDGAPEEILMTSLSQVKRSHFDLT